MDNFVDMSVECFCRMERDMVKDKREAWERDVEKMRQILAAQGCPLCFYVFHILLYCV